MIRIGLDAMGGDHGPTVIVPAAKRALQYHPDLHLVLVGQADVLTPLVQKHKLPTDRYTIHPATEIVAMDESPALALRNKKDSSMRVAINLVKEGVVQACVSAGNTGALMATSKFVLKTLPGIDRPAIISALPTLGERFSYMLDLGANVDSTAQQLLQFAVMASSLVSAVDNIPAPKVALLNIGAEEIKGNALVKETAELLTNLKEINYVGFVEGDDIYKGIVDVIVCDGFAGNIALKASEGIAKMMAQRIKENFTRNFMTKLAALIAAPVLRNIKRQFDPGRYNGASLLGLQGIVIKSHGSADVKGYAHAISEAVREVEKNIPHLIGAQIAKILKDISPV